MIYSVNDLIPLIETGKSFFSSISRSKKYKETFDYLQNIFQVGSKTELIYLYVNGYTEVPKCSCGKNCQFLSYEKGYEHFCKDISCANRQRILKERTKETNIQRYGVDNPSKSESVKNKRKSTNLERYGVDNVSRVTEVKEKRELTWLSIYNERHPSKSESVKNKRKSTNLERYGVESLLEIPDNRFQNHQDESVKNKRKSTNLERYGTHTPSKSERIKSKMRNTNLERYGVESVLRLPEIRERIKSTNLERYGVESVLRLPEIRERIKDSLQSRYGVDYPSQSLEIRERIKDSLQSRYGVDHNMKIPEVRDRVVESMQERYGVDNALQSPELMSKLINTNLERYGVKNVSQNPEVLEKSKITRWINYYSKFKEDLKFIPVDISKPIKSGDPVIWKCCNHTSEYIDFNGPLSARCPICDPPAKIGSSLAEREIQEFISEIYSGNIICNDRNIIHPKELDIYLPDINLAIEYNGVYWHSSGSIEEELFFESKHLDKTRLCESSGINLFHISEMDWINPLKKEIIKSMIKHKLGLSKRIFARNTLIREVSQSDSKIFLERNHLQGNVNSKIRLGLYHQGNLVSLMTFGIPRFNKKIDWELLRFSTLKGSAVVGGAQKLLTYFRNHFEGSIISYANRDHSNGNLYTKLGFELVGESGASYYWFNNTKILTRYQTQKGKLKDLLKEGFDATLTESQNMYNNGYRKYFGSGNLVFKLN